MNFKRMTDLDLAGKRVFIRADLNVPVKDGKVTSDARITASMPTIEHAMKAGAKVMVTSHLGRPTEGQFNPEDSLQPVAEVTQQDFVGAVTADGRERHTEPQRRAFGGEFQRKTQRRAGGRGQDFKAGRPRVRRILPAKQRPVGVWQGKSRGEGCDRRSVAWCRRGW